MCAILPFWPFSPPRSRPQFHPPSGSGRPIHSSMRPSHLHGPAVALLLLCVAAGARGSTVSLSQGPDGGRVARPAAAGAAAAVGGAAATPTPDPLDRPEDKACL